MRAHAEELFVHTRVHRPRVIGERRARVLELEGDADAGGPVYERVCQECHDADGAGKSRTLSEIVPASTDDELANVVAGGGHVSTSAMTEQEAADLIAYLRELR